MPSRERKRGKKRQEEYVLNRDYELESSQVRYDADAEQRRASAHDMYRANLRWQQEKNSVAVRASKMRRYELKSDEKRAFKRESLAREFRTNGTAEINITVNIVLLGNKLNMGITIFIVRSSTLYYMYTYILLVTYCLQKKRMKQDIKNILSEKVSSI